MIKKELLWINLLRAICILCVYYVHSQSYYGFGIKGITAYIHPFYVNSFFLVSGYLLFRKHLSTPLVNLNGSTFLKVGAYKEFLNILYRLIIPTVLFAAIEFIPSYMLRGKEIGFEEFLYKTVGGCTYWFTSALVVAELLVLLLLLTRRKSIWFYFIFTSFVFGIGKYMCREGFEFSNQYPSCPWQYKEGLLSIIFLGFGGMYWKYEDLLRKVLKKYMVILLAFTYVVVETICPNSFRVLVSLQDVNMLGLLISIVAFVVLVEICKLPKSSKILNYVGRNTIGLYFLSGAFPIVLSMFVHRVMPTRNIVGLLIVFVGSFSLSFLTVYFMNRYAAWLFDGRKLLKK